MARNWASLKMGVVVNKKGSEGGKARAQSLTQNERTQQARNAAAARWQGRRIIGREYLLESSAVQLLAVVSGEWAVVRVGDEMPFVCDVNKLKKRGVL